MPRTSWFPAAAALILTMTLWAVFSGVSDPMRSRPDLERVIADAVRDFQPISDSGIAVAVIKDRQLYYTGGFGLRDRGSSAKVDADTFFGIGSATKAFTSMAISMLAAQNANLRLDVPIKQYLPDFAMKDPEAGDKMTLEQLLSHRGGLPRHDALWYLGPFTRSQLYYRLRYLEPYPQAFGTTFCYNNLIYMTAGYLLEALAGQSWETFVKARILDPLGMSATDLSIAELAARPNHAKPYQLDAEMPLKDVENIGPAAEINSTVPEMSKWVLLFLNRGVASNGTTLISAADLERMYTPYVTLPGGSGNSYGLGWFIGNTGGKRLIFHQGDTDGYSTYVSFMPDDGLGVIILTNQHATSFPDKVAAKIYEYLLTAPTTAQAHLPRGLAQVTPPQAAVTAACTALSPPPSPVPVTDYLGMYSHPGYGDITIGSGGHDYVSYYHHNWPLHRQADGTFTFDMHAFGTDFHPRVFFHKTAAGKVDSLGIRFEPSIDPIQFIRR